MEIQAGGGVFGLGNPGGRGGHSDPGNPGWRGGSKNLAIRPGGVDFFWNNPLSLPTGTLQFIHWTAIYWAWSGALLSFGYFQRSGRF